jgi:TolA-binding protein
MMDPLLSALGVFLIVVAATTVTSAVALGVHALRNRHRGAFEQGIAELARLQSETGVRIEGMRDMLADRQAELHRRQ